MNGTLVLDGANNADSVFIFQTATTLITGGTGNVTFIRGAQACNVFWKVGSAATLGAGSSFSGTILAHDDISLGDGVTVTGRLLAARAGKRRRGDLDPRHDHQADELRHPGLDRHAAAAQLRSRKPRHSRPRKRRRRLRPRPTRPLRQRRRPTSRQPPLLRLRRLLRRLLPCKAAAAARRRPRKPPASSQGRDQKAAASKAAKAARVANAAAASAATAKRVALKLSSIRRARTHAGFTG